MPSATHRSLHPSPRRSPRFINTHVVYNKYSEKEISTMKHVKTEIIDLEEIVPPSMLEINVTSIGGNDVEEEYYNVSLKDLRAHCKAKSQKAQKFISDGPNTTNHTQYGNLVKENPIEEVDLDEPLISLKQKSQKTPPSKTKRKMDISISSPHAPYTTSKRYNTSPVQASPDEISLHDSVTGKRKRRRTGLEHSKTVVDLTNEIVRDDIICYEMEGAVLSAGALTVSGSPDTSCKPKTEDIDIYINEEVGVSRPTKDSFEHSSVELLQVPIEDDGCEQQPCFITRPSELHDVSANSCELTHSVEAYSLDNIVLQNKTFNIVSSMDLTDEVSSHPKQSDIISSDVPVGNEYLTCCVNQSCDGDIDNDAYWHPGVQGSPESIKTVEESSPTNEFNTEIQSPLVVMQSDLCVSRDITCKSLEEVVQMQVEGQSDPLHHAARPKDVLLHMDQAATAYNFAFDKTIDFVQITNCATQDGRLESIVYDALNNHAQRKKSENKTFGARDAAMVSSPQEDGFIDNCPNEPDGEILFSDNTEWSSKDTSQLNATMDSEICRSNNDKRSREQSVFHPQLMEACVDMDKTVCVTSENSTEEIQEMPAGGGILNPQEIHGHRLKSGPFIDEEGSTEEHAPKKLFSKRKIMSPTSQEKLCNALTGINLCGVQRLRKKILLEDCDTIRRTLPKVESKQDQSMLSADARFKGRTLSPTSKEVFKLESSSPQQTCCCMRSSSVLFDTEKAVQFSQRQMHDIENIAAKLIQSLKHMKSIVDESLSSEAAHSLLPNFSTAEIMAASEDALEVERTTRKWLMMMNKDCNRFCKILTLAGKKAISLPEVPRKERKIIFADEAGGTLCHVKVFNDGQTSLSEIQREL